MKRAGRFTSLPGAGSGVGDPHGRQAPLAVAGVAGRGFVMLELLVVVAVMVVISAVAVPNLAKARRSANEAAAQSEMRLIQSVQTTYQQGPGLGDYATDFATLFNEGYIDAALASGVKNGYVFSLTASGSAFRANADPAVPGRTGGEYYFNNQTGVVRYSTTGPADETSPPRGVMEERDAKTLVKLMRKVVPKAVLRVALSYMDSDDSGELSFDEVLVVDILGMARGIVEVLYFDVELGGTVASDGALAALLSEYLNQVGEDLQLGAGDENVEELPQIPLAELEKGSAVSVPE